MFDRITGVNPWQPWQQGREPEPSSSRQHKPFLDGQEPNCPEFPRTKWQKGKDGKWFNNEVCTSNEEENDDDEEHLVVDDADDIADELGTVESSEEEDDDQKAKQ